MFRFCVLILCIGINTTIVSFFAWFAMMCFILAIEYIEYIHKIFHCPWTFCKANASMMIITMAIDDIINKIGYRLFVYSSTTNERWTINAECSIQQHFRISCNVHSSIRSKSEYLFLWKVLFIQFRGHKCSFHYYYLTGNISNERQLIRLLTFNFWFKFNLCEYIVKMLCIHWNIHPPITTDGWGWLCLYSYLNYEYIYNWIFEFLRTASNKLIDIIENWNENSHKKGKWIPKRLRYYGQLFDKWMPLVNIQIDFLGQKVNLV